jgi:glycosyltransferase involved in cell wall biosynthesis
MPEKEKRNIIIMPEYRWGGAETQFRAYIEHARKNGIKIDVIISHRFGNYKDELPRENNGVIRFFEINSQEDMDAFLNRELQNVCYGTCIIYMTRDLAFFDIVHKYGIKVIYSERNDGAEVLCNSGYSDVLKKCYLITTNSKYASEKINKHLKTKVITVNNGIKIEPMLFVNDNTKIRNILVPARIDANKNQLSVFKFLMNEKGKYNITFAGRIHNKAYYLRVKHFAEDNELMRYVEFIGDVKDMRELYKKADVVINPSLVEGTPNIVLEAYMLGRPVITTDIEAERGLVDSRFMYSVSDYAGISKCLERLASMSKEDYMKLIQDNRNRIVNEYRMEKMTSAYDKLLAQDFAIDEM